MSGKYTEFELQTDGNLKIALLPEAQQDVQEIADNTEWDADTKLEEVLGWQLGNGWTWMRPEDIGALTEAPILSEEVDTDKQGNITQVGTVYWYADYEMLDPVEQLLKNGSIVFVRGQ